MSVRKWASYGCVGVAYMCQFVIYWTLGWPQSQKKKPKRLDKTKGGITLTWICFFPQPTFLPLLLRELNWFSVFYRFRHNCKPIDWVTTKRKVIHLHQSMKNNLAFSFFLWLLVSCSFQFNSMPLLTLNRCV